ncbi:MAG TPA: sulfite exporter TauE/SafE family protein [Actinomycetales bacterium]|nr:sulfite exporter TauE/SafE family protein [Actinomycetales bacterium]
MPEVSTLGWVALVFAAFLVGVAKTSVGTAASMSVALFAAVLPARESTGTLLPLLLVGDVLAVSTYRQHANWPLLRRLLPWVALGLPLGAVFVAAVGDSTMRRTIALLLLVLLVLQVVRRRTGTEPRPHSPVLPAGVGGVAGFCTMVANAAGPVMAQYLLLMRAPKLAFLGTSAWFFLVVNLAKLPFTGALGLVSGPLLLLDLALAPLVVLGGLTGRQVARRLQQRHFEAWTLGLTAVSCVALLR